MRKKNFERGALLAPPLGALSLWSSLPLKSGVGRGSFNPFCEKSSLGLKGNA
jgi:hypothetical protein